MSYLISKQNYHELVVGFDTQVQLRNGRKTKVINFDNAATTPPLISVIEEIKMFAPLYSSIHRGAGYKSRISSEKYEDARKTVMEFVGADSKKDVVIFVKNATEAINKVAYRLSQHTEQNPDKDNEKYVILSTSMEHHSNDLPWRGKYEVDYIDIDECGRLMIKDLVKKLEKHRGRVKLVTVTGASNVTGYINPVQDIAELAHKYGAMILVDGSQLIPHFPFNMKQGSSNRHIDFLVFSAHKMYAPFGIGVLIGPKDIFERGSPDYAGGGTVRAVTPDIIVWNDPPSKDEAGTPNLMGVIALAAAIKTLTAVGMKNIAKHEKALTKHLIQGLKKIECLEIYCTEEEQERVAIVPFNMKGVYHALLAEMLSGEAGISVRSGCFCAHPYVQRLLKLSPARINKLVMSPWEEKPGMVRVSFGMYNNHDEVDRLLQVLHEIARDRRRYMKIYA